MSLENFKITQEQIIRNGVSSAPDKLTGSAADNKAVFDNLIKTIVANSINEIIGTLTSSAGAQSIGMNDLYGEQEGLNVFSAVEKMRLKTNADKSDKTVTDNHIKDVEHDEKTGTFKFIRENGEEIVIDTALEKITVNFSYDSDTESIVIELMDGTTQNIPLSSFISETDWVESDTVKFNVNQHKVSAVVKYGSITDEHLSSTLRDNLISYVTAAENFSSRAQESENSAGEYAEKANQSVISATLLCDDAYNSAQNAEIFKEQSKQYASEAEVNAQNAEIFKEQSKQYASEAQNARDEAVEIAGFDPTNYVQKTDKAELGGDYGLVKLNSAVDYGLKIRNGTGDLVIAGATTKVLNKLTSEYMPITPANLTYAVKVGLLNNADGFSSSTTTTDKVLSDDEKKAICNWLGAAYPKEHVYFSDTVDIVNNLTTSGDIYLDSIHGIYNQILEAGFNSEYLHQCNIFKKTGTVWWSKYEGVGGVPENEHPCQINCIHDGISFAFLMKLGTGLSEAWQLDFSELKNNGWIKKFKDDSGVEFSVQFYLLGGEFGLDDSALQWWVTDNTAEPSASNLMNEACQKYIFLYM